MAAQTQPDAVRIDWSAGAAAQSLDLGKGTPVVYLLHEAAGALRSQVVPTGRVQGRQQRAAWLDLGAQFRGAAMVALLAGLAVLGWHLSGAWRRQRKDITP